MKTTTSLLLLSLFCLPALAAAEDTAWEDHLRAAATAYDKGDMQDALLHYSKARLIRDLPKLQLQVAHVHERLGECNAARLLYGEVVEEAAATADVRTMASELTGKRAPVAIMPNTSGFQMVGEF